MLYHETPLLDVSHATAILALYISIPSKEDWNCNAYLSFAEEIDLIESAHDFYLRRTVSHIKIEITNELRKVCRTFILENTAQQT